MKQTLGLYIHIPFCIKKCNYCDFCSFAHSSPSLMENYTSELCRRLEMWARKADSYIVDTVYFGGGTPTTLPLNCFEKLFSAAVKNYHISANAEISCECNPATANQDYLSALRSLGVNRLSIGLQSTHDRELKKLGRAHSFDDFLNTYSSAREAGFANISVDLMYALPSQSLLDFEESLRRVTELHPEHISSYCLKIEEGTRFFEEADRLELPDDDTQLRMYLLMSDMLSASGYSKYEISNFSLQGKESRHNMRYWQGLDYLGFGVAAHSKFQGQRFGNSRDIEGFIQGDDIECERYTLTHNDLRNEYIMLKLRLASGLELSEYKALFSRDLLLENPNINTYINNELMKVSDGCLAFTDRGFFVSNYILSELLDF